MQRKFRPLPEDDAVEEPLINLTPLIDVVFVVLIAFILIAPILNIDSVDLASSIGKEKKELETSLISISVHKDNSIWFQGKKMSLKELRTFLEKEKKRHPNAVPQVIHDKKAEFGTYQALKNTLESIGFQQMDIVLEPG